MDWSRVCTFSKPTTINTGLPLLHEIRQPAATSRASELQDAILELKQVLEAKQSPFAVVCGGVGKSLTLKHLMNKDKCYVVYGEVKPQIFDDWKNEAGDRLLVIENCVIAESCFTKIKRHSNTLLVVSGPPPPYMKNGNVQIVQFHPLMDYRHMYNEEQFYGKPIMNMDTLLGHPSYMAHNILHQRYVQRDMTREYVRDVMKQLDLREFNTLQAAVEFAHLKSTIDVLQPDEYYKGDADHDVDHDGQCDMFRYHEMDPAIAVLQFSILSKKNALSRTTRLKKI
jgi:hypothetical protein